MAEIGIMKKLTIGGSTYTIPEYNLPIASASTLGGVKIGTGLSINSTTGVLSATGLDYDETDPVFIASAAYGITSSDISNWNSKTSNTGTITKVQTSAGAHSTVNISSGNVSFNVPTKTSHLTNDSGYLTSTDIASVLKYKGTKASYSALPSTGNTTGDVWHLTDTGAEYAWDGSAWQELGTAIDTSSFLTSESDPVFSASAAAGITSTDISNWNAKSDLDEKVKQTPLNGENTTKNLLLSYALSTSGTVATTNQIYTATYMRYNDYTPVLTLHNKLDNTKQLGIYSTSIGFKTGSYTATLLATTQTANHSISLPDKAGTVALTDDIPDTSSFITDAGVTKITTTAGSHTAITNSTGAVSFNVPTKTSHLTNDSGFITSYTDENMKWTASTSSNTYYPLTSTSTATTSTANTLNGINFYQYYNTAGGYRRLTLGNSTAYTSSGGAYGLVRLYGAPATYYGDLVPGVLSTSSTGRLTANRTWTLPDATGTIALTSDIPSYTDTNTTYTLTNALSSHKFTWTFTAGGSGSGSTTTSAELVAGTGITLTDDTTNNKITIASNVTVPTKTSDLTNDSGYITSYTDEKVKVVAGSSSTSYYPILATEAGTATRQYLSTIRFYDSSDYGTQFILGKNDGTRQGLIQFWSKTSGYYIAISPTNTLTANRGIKLPDKDGTIALTSDIPAVKSLTFTMDTTDTKKLKITYA